MDRASELATTATIPPPAVTIQTVRRNPSLKRLLKLPIWSSGKSQILFAFLVLCLFFSLLYRKCHDI